MDNKKLFAVIASVLVLGAGVFAYTYSGNSNSADGSTPPGITIDYPKFKGEMNPNVICNIPKAYKFTSDADSKYKTGDAEAKDLQSGIHIYHSDKDLSVQDIVDRIDSVSGNAILIAYYPSSGNPSNLFSVFPELKGQNAISATAAKTYKIPAHEGFTIFSCKASKIYGIKTETEFGSDLPAILKSKADSGWVLMAAKDPKISNKTTKVEMKEVNDDNKSNNKPKIKSAWPQKGKGFSFSGSQQPDALAVDSTYKMVWVEMSTEDITKDPTPELTLYATNGSEVSVKKGDTVVLDFIELMSSNKVANVKSIDFSNAVTDTLANLSGYKLFSSIKSDDGKTLKDAKEVMGCTIQPVSLKINVACTTGSLSINPASPLYLELKATIAQTAVLTKTFKLSIASLDDIKIYESGFKKTNYYASPAYTAGVNAAINLPIYWNTYTVSEAAAPNAGQKLAGDPAPTAPTIDKIDTASISKISWTEADTKSFLKIDNDYKLNYRWILVNGSETKDIDKTVNSAAIWRIDWDGDVKKNFGVESEKSCVETMTNTSSNETQTTWTCKYVTLPPDVIKNLKAGGTYTWVMQAGDGKQPSAQASQTFTMPSTVKPSAPTDLTFDTSTNKLSWTDTEKGITKYKIVHDKNPSIEVTDTTYTFKANEYDSKIYNNLGVIACKDTACSDMSGVVQVPQNSSGTYTKDGKVPKLATLPAPVGLTVLPTQSTISSISFFWTKPDDISKIDHYILTCSKDPSTNVVDYVDLDSITSDKMFSSCSGLEANTNYTASLSIVGKEKGSFSTAATATGKTSALLPAPTGFKESANKTTTNSITLEWLAPSPSPQGYKLIYSSNGVPSETIDNIKKDAISQKIDNLSPDTTYSFSLYAVDGNNDTGEEAKTTAKTKEEAPKVAQPPSAPANFKLVSKTDSSAFFNWEKPTSDGGSPVTKYNLFYGPGVCTGTNATKNDLILVNYPYDEIKGLSESTAYGAYVRATNNVNSDTNWSEKSACLDFTTLSKQSTAPAISSDPTFQYIFDNAAHVYWNAVNVDAMDGKFKVNYRKGGCSSPSTEETIVNALDAKNSSAPPAYVKVLGTPYTTYDLKPGTKYGVTVKVSNDGTTWSAESTCKEFTTTGKAIVPEVINLYDIIKDSYGKCSDGINGTCKAGETCIEIFGSQHICKTDANAYMYQCNATYTCPGGPYVCWNNYKCAGQASCLDSNGKEVGKASGTGYVCSGTYKCTQGLSCDNASGSGCTGTKTCQ